MKEMRWPFAVATISVVNCVQPRGTPSAAGPKMLVPPVIAVPVSVPPQFARNELSGTSPIWFEYQKLTR